jgi:hypothetical protein
VKEVNPVTELQTLKFTDSVNNIEFRLQGDNAPQEIIRLDSEGFHYRGQLIEDAGEAHQLMVEFLKQSTQSQSEPVAPTDEEIMELMPQQMRDDLANAARALAGFDRANVKAAGAMRIILNRQAVNHARAVLACYGTPANALPTPEAPNV